MGVNAIVYSPMCIIRNKGTKKKLKVKPLKVKSV